MFVPYLQKGKVKDAKINVIVRNSHEIRKSHDHNSPAILATPLGVAKVERRRSVRLDRDHWIEKWAVDAIETNFFSLNQLETAP